MQSYSSETALTYAEQGGLDRDGNRSIWKSGSWPTNYRKLEVIQGYTGPKNHAIHGQAYRVGRCTQGTGLVYIKYLDGSAQFQTIAASGFNTAGLFHIRDWDWARDVAYNQALDRLNEKVRGSVDLSVDFAEAGQTKDLAKKLVSSTLGFAETLRKFRKNPLSALPTNSRKARQLRKDLTNAYLEYTYGIKPLVGTLYGIYEKIYKPEEPKLTRLIGRSRQSCSLPTRAGVQPIIGPWPGDIGYFNLEGRAYAQCEIGLYLELQDPSALQSLGGFTSLNPVSLAWELLPYSFVVDWVFNLGGYIRNLETALCYGSLSRGGWVTFVMYQELASGGFVGNQNNVFGEIPSSASRTIAKERSPLGSYPFPRLPRLELDLSSGHLFNAAALLSNLLR
jgi:hypothetical protein